MSFVRSPHSSMCRSNKVYGDAPNEIAIVETETRWDYADPAYASGIRETFQNDQSKHSIFGASKVAADILVQEYGRYFGMPTCCLRAVVSPVQTMRGRTSRLSQFSGSLQRRTANYIRYTGTKENRFEIIYTVMMLPVLSNASSTRLGQARYITLEEEGKIRSPS